MGLASVSRVNSRSAAFWAMGLIVVATVISYGNSFQCPFISDDELAILDNPTIHQLWPIGRVLSPPSQGCAVTSRPITNLSLAINYAIGGEEVGSYHALNLLAHISTALLLFAILRRTFLLPGPEKYVGDAATPLAFAIVLLWAVHPLLTNAVTYVVQRTEVLAGLFYLLTLYCAIRGSVGSHAKTWNAGALAAYLLAMGSKESAVSAPLIVLFYDRVFLTGSWRETFRRRWRLYSGFVAVLTLLWIHHLLTQDGKQIVPNDWRMTCEYAMAQCWSIVHYLRLSFVPYPLILDYGSPKPQSMLQILPHFLLLGLLGVGMVWAWRRQPWISFLGIWFLAILAPSSSMIPIWSEVAAEKRMYLPLAAVLTCVVIGVYFLGRRMVQGGWLSERAARRVGIALTLSFTICFSMLTVERNRTYGNALGIWRDTIEKMPDNPRAYNSLGILYANMHQTALALRCYEEAVRLAPFYASAHDNRGRAYAQCGEFQKALECYRKALDIEPGNVEMRCHRAAALEQSGQGESALLEYENMIATGSPHAIVYHGYGSLLIRRGRLGEAVGVLRKALEFRPDYATTHGNLANALAAQGKYAEAAQAYREALKRDPNHANVCNNYAILLSTCPEASERDGVRAVALAERAVELSKACEPIPIDTLAAAYAEVGQFSEAARNEQRAIDLAAQQGKPKLVEVFSKKLQLYQTGVPFRMSWPAVDGATSPR